MPDFSAGGRDYRTCPMSVVDQFALLQRLRPILPALGGLDFSLRVEGAGIADIASALSPLTKAPEDDMRAVFAACLAATQVREEGSWRSVGSAPPLPILMRIATEIIAENFAVLFAMKRPAFQAAHDDDPIVYTPVSMPDGEDWLYRPVLRGLCRIESLYDRTLRIEQVAKLNDALDCEDENQARARKAAKKK